MIYLSFLEKIKGLPTISYKGIINIEDKDIYMEGELIPRTARSWTLSIYKKEQFPSFPVFVTYTFTSVIRKSLLKNRSKEFYCGMIDQILDSVGAKYEKTEVTDIDHDS